MKLSFLSFLAVTACVAVGSLFGQNVAQDVVDKSTGLSFPSEVTIDQNGKKFHLQITGVATRKKFFVKVYSVASYLQDGGAPAGDKFAEFFDDQKAKQLTLKWVHEGPADKVKDGYIESFKTNLTPEQFTALKSDIDTWLSFFNRDVQKGDEQVIRWLPGGYVEFAVNGQKIGRSINNVEFAKGLWSLWFGPKTSFDKASLVSLMK